MWYLPSAIFANHAARVQGALAAVGVAWETSDVERCQPLLRQAIRRTHPDKTAGSEDLCAGVNRAFIVMPLISGLVTA